jgi:aryl-alcohol dehydrogenase-like predicted oxidoreductase
MRTRPLGQSGIEASVVAFGAWAIGGWRWGGTDESQSVRAIHAAIDAGITLFDTAPVYGFGLSDSILGGALQGKRDRVILATKCGLICDPTKGSRHFTTNALSFDDDALIQVNRYCGGESIKREVEASLRRLKTDHIDLLQTHWQDTTTPFAETMGAMMELKKAGKVRAIGVCNATAAQMAEYRKAGPLDSDQERYSMLARDVEKDQLPYCREHRVAMLAYSPLAQGLLTGKLTASRQFALGDLRKDNPKFGAEVRQRVAKLLAKFEPVRARHGITMTQLVIAWTIAQPGVTHALCGARTPEQAIENAKAGDVALWEEEVQQMTAAVDAF